jgi:methylated-DNA-[protein]-cysteine S-methyltransferase
MNSADIHQVQILTPIGALTIYCRHEFLTEIKFTSLNNKLCGIHNAFSREVTRQIDAYFKSADFQFDLPLNYSATPHQEKVWRALMDIPRGRVKTYGELATLLHSSPRAIGQACGANPIPIVIPCHRVISKAGLGGFMRQSQGESLDIKRQLLAHEQY